MKYTFLLPAYKGRFLDEMLRSIQGQTYTDFKVIISDDCSPEDIYSICQPYLSDPRFTYRRNEENMGSKSLVSHWNMLVDMCDTEYLIMASDDDVYEAQFLEEIDLLTVKYPEVDLFRARAKRIDENGKTLICDGSFDEIVDDMHFMQQCFLPIHIRCIANYCFRTISLKGKKGFVDFPLAWTSDEATTMLMSEHSCCNTAHILFGFRQSDIQISGIWGNAEDSKLKVKAFFDFWQWFKSFFLPLLETRYIAEPDLPWKVWLRIRTIRESQIEGFLIHCKWTDFHRFARQYRQEFSASYIVMLYYWARHKFSHLFPSKTWWWLL